MIRPYRATPALPRGRRLQPLALVVLVALPLGAASCGRKAPEGIAPWLGVPVAVSPVGRSAENPWLALGPERTVYVTWTSEAEIWLAASGDGGKRFGAPVRVNDDGSEFTGFVEDPPKLAVAADGTVYAAWTGKLAGKDRMSAIFLAASTDGGATFGKPVRVSDDPGTGFHLCESLATDATGAVHVAWIDGRGIEREGSDALMLYTARSVDRGRSFSPNSAAVRKDVCPCCRTALAVGGDGRPVLVYRHVYPDQSHDVAVARAGAPEDTAAWSLARVNEDGWRIRGCPDNGPAMALDPGGTMHIAWFTATEPAGLRYATSKDGGATFRNLGRLQPPAEGTDSAHPTMAIAGDGTVWVAWDDGGTDGRRRVRIAAKPGGRTGFAAPIPVAYGEWQAFAPVIAAREAGSISIAWVIAEGDTSRVVFATGKPPVE